jgi:hypothetical protein
MTFERFRLAKVDIILKTTGPKEVYHETLSE